MHIVVQDLKDLRKIVARYFFAIKRRLYYRNPLNIFLGQKLFGNDSGLLANVVGALALSKDRIFSSTAYGQIFSKKVEHFRQKGWVAFDDVNFGSDLQNLRQKLADYCEQHQVPNSQRLEVSTIGNANFFRDFPEVKNILNKELQEFIRQYYGAHFQVLNVHLYRIFPVPSQLSQNLKYRPYGATGCWHNDGSTTESIKMFVLIDEVDEEQGPMHVIAADETKKIIRKQYFQYEKDGLPGSRLEKNATIVKFTGKAGKVLFANPNICLHRASEPMPGRSRDMLVFYLTSSSRPLAENWEQNAINEQSMGLRRLIGWFSKRQ